MVIGGVGMKHKSLFIRSVIFIIIPIVLVGIIVSTSITSAIETYFRDQSFETLKLEHERYVGAYSKEEVRAFNVARFIPKRTTGSAVAVSKIVPSRLTQNAILIENNDGTLRFANVPEAIVRDGIEALKNNKVWPIHGTLNEDDIEYYYIIDPLASEQLAEKFEDLDVKSIYLMSYVSQSYSQSLSNHVLKVFYIGMLGILTTMALAIFLVFKRIGRRLKGLESGAEEIGLGNFEHKISQMPSDEIGRLGASMNAMGKQLSMTRQVQSEEFQTISHELKTPIMVMSGFVDAMKEGKYPSGSLEGTIDILEDELGKLQSLVGNLLMLTKMQYLAKNNIVMEQLQVEDIISETFERLKLEYPAIKLHLMGSMKVLGDHDSWSRIIENILTNQLRYAKNSIEVFIDTSIVIRNDGPLIPVDELDAINQPYYHGEDGKTGLGLSIIRNTLKLYHMTLTISNSDSGVEYKIM